MTNLEIQLHVSLVTVQSVTRWQAPSEGLLIKKMVIDSPRYLKFVWGFCGI